MLVFIPSDTSFHLAVSPATTAGEFGSFGFCKPLKSSIKIGSVFNTRPRKYPSMRRCRSLYRPMMRGIRCRQYRALGKLVSRHARIQCGVWTSRPGRSGHRAQTAGSGPHPLGRLLTLHRVAPIVPRTIARPRTRAHRSNSGRASCRDKSQIFQRARRYPLSIETQTQQSVFWPTAVELSDRFGSTPRVRGERASL